MTCVLLEEHGRCDVATEAQTSANQLPMLPAKSNTATLRKEESALRMIMLHVLLAAFWQVHVFFLKRTVLFKPSSIQRTQHKSGHCEQLENNILNETRLHADLILGDAEHTLCEKCNNARTEPRHEQLESCSGRWCEYNTGVGMVLRR